MMIVALLVGVVFGFALEKSKVLQPEVILGQFQLKNWTMVKVFLSAIMTGLIIYSLLFTLGFERLAWKVTIFPRDILGGLFLGTGIALAGACPGTVLAQVGVGYKDAIFAVLGGLVGVYAFNHIGPHLPDWPSEILLVETILDLPFAVVAIPLAFILGAFLFIIERKLP